MAHKRSAIKRGPCNNNSINNILISPTIAIIICSIDHVNDHNCLTPPEVKKRLWRLRKHKLFMMVSKLVNRPRENHFGIWGQVRGTQNHAQLCSKWIPRVTF